jgi:hypothetical protein
MTNVMAMLQAVAAVGDAIRSLGSVPSGHLYARLMGHLTLDQYTSIIEVLKKSGLVAERSHVLTWVGPPAEHPTGVSEHTVATEKEIT